MNIEQLQKDKEIIERKFNQLIGTELMEFLNKYKDMDVNVNIDYDTKETMDGTKYLTGNTKIRVEL